MQQSRLDWRLRDIVSSKIIKAIPMTKESIMSQVKNKIRTYMDALSLPQSPKCQSRQMRSPQRRTSTLSTSLPSLAGIREQKDIAGQAVELKKLMLEAIEEKNIVRLLQSTDFATQFA